VINGIVVFFSVLILISIKNIAEIISKEAELETVKSEMKNTESLIDLLRQQRHDHINHIQTIQAMLYLEEIDDAKEYLQGIGKNYQYMGTIIRLGNPVLTALINTKKELALKYDINIEIVSATKIALENVKAWDLSSIMGNLIDNAIDHSMENAEEKRIIKIDVKRDKTRGKVVLHIENYLNNVNFETERMFDQGYSTKDSAGRGYGLFIVKELVEKYKGDIDCRIIDDRIRFTLELGE